MAHVWSILLLNIESIAMKISISDTHFLIFSSNFRVWRKKVMGRCVT